MYEQKNMRYVWKECKCLFGMCERNVRVSILYMQKQMRESI